MNFSFTDISGFSVLLAGIIGLFLYSRIEKCYYPFLYMMWLAGINEGLSYYLYKNHHRTTVNNNIYVLCEALLILWFFRRNRLFQKRKKGFWALFIGLVTVWLAEAAILTIHRDFSYFRILYSFITVLMSIHTINIILVSGEQNLLRHSLFLISLAFVFYYTYKALVEPFYIYEATSSDIFRKLIYRIHNQVNLVVNLIYALAILWIPRKQPSILPS
jgi:hypothetical protein